MAVARQCPETGGTRYATLKAGPAEQFPDDRDAYTEAKSDFVAETLRSAGVAPPPRNPAVDA